MCGIVGYIGPKQAAPFLLEGLRKLEYRGYDSEGIAVYNGVEIIVDKCVGRLGSLEKKIEGQIPQGHMDYFAVLWKQYFATMEIRERHNEQCQNHLLPKWYRKYMTEWN